MRRSNVTTLRFSVSLREKIKIENKYLIDFKSYNYEKNLYIITKLFSYDIIRTE